MGNLIQPPNTVNEKRNHWNRRFGANDVEQLSWYERVPRTSLALMEVAGVRPHHSVIDVGGGTSHLIDYLLSRGHTDLACLDLSETALELSRKRLGECADNVVWLTYDVTRFHPQRSWDLWHDRALFHFMTDVVSREAYVAALHDAVPLGGHAIIATFADDGPEQCSGLATQRYSPSGLADALGDGFDLIEARRHHHLTPRATEQRFVYGLFRRR